MAEAASSIWDVLNSLAAVSAMLVSAYAVHHSRRVDRRLSLEPYFRYKWRSVHRDYVYSLERLESWLAQYDNWSRSPGHVLDSLPMITPSVHRDIDWQYQPDARLPFEQLAAIVDRLQGVVARQNQLRSITSDSRRTMLQLIDIGAAEYQESHELQEYIRHVSISCLGTADVTIGQLRESPKYIAMIERDARALKEDVARARILLSTVRKTVDHFGAKFEAV